MAAANQPTDKELDEFFASLPEFSGGGRKKSHKKSHKKSGRKYATALSRKGKYRQLATGRCTHIRNSKVKKSDLVRTKSGSYTTKKMQAHGKKMMRKNRHMMAAPYS